MLNWQKTYKLDLIGRELSPDKSPGGQQQKQQDAHYKEFQRMQHQGL